MAGTGGVPFYFSSINLTAFNYRGAWFAYCSNTLDEIYKVAIRWMKSIKTENVCVD